MRRVLGIAHIAGVPVEETALTIAPVAAALGAAAMVRLRGRFDRNGGVAEAEARRKGGSRP